MERGRFSEKDSEESMKKKKKTNMDVQCPLLKKYKIHKKSFTSKSGTKSMLDILFKTRSH